MNEFTKIAKYIHSESPEPISEIEWLMDSDEIKTGRVIL